MLTSSERRTLKARAHQLEPAAIFGAKGPTARKGNLRATGAEQVQNVGKIFVLFRKNDE